MPLRQQAELKQQVDVIIDAKAVILHKVVRWSEEAAMAAGHSVVLIDTDSPDCAKSSHTLSP